MSHQTVTRQRMNSMQRLVIILAAACGLFFAAVTASQGWQVSGVVLCDADQSGHFGPGDTPLTNLFVIVTNISGTFSNMVLTATDGTFVSPLPSVPDTYGVTLSTATLPPLGTIVVPTFGVTFFDVTAARSSFVANFLVSSPAYRSNEVTFLTEGVVFCDANNNHQLDASDVPLQGVLVGATNFQGTFSNATYTTASGRFSLPLPGSGVFAEFLDPATLPPGSTVVFPHGAVLVGVNAGHPVDLSGYLIFSPGCTNEGKASASASRVLEVVNTRGPVAANDAPLAKVVTNLVVDFPIGSAVSHTNELVKSNGWRFDGRGITGNSEGPEHVFEGRVFKDCKPGGHWGDWSDVSQQSGLRFKSSRIETVTFGELPGATAHHKPLKCMPAFVELSGTGTLKGIAGNKTDFGPVRFFARCEDCVGTGVEDRYYLRVYGSGGVTLLLVSGDEANPLVVAPVTISLGIFEVQRDECEEHQR
jgi:hypothetical protein